MLASYLMSVQIRSISEIEVSDILKCFDKSSVLRLPRKTSSPPKIVIPDQTKVSIFYGFLSSSILLFNLT